jgi:hypothetical protein
MVAAAKPAALLNNLTGLDLAIANLPILQEFDTPTSAKMLKVAPLVTNISLHRTTCSQISFLTP